MKYIALFILFIFSLLWLVGCSPDEVPDKTATVIITTDCNKKDTIIISYYKDLQISFGNLMDGNDNIKVYGIKYFSILNQKEK